jgi:hypothetical protein
LQFTAQECVEKFPPLRLIGTFYRNLRRLIFYL